jgi:hypothetical protein
MDSRLRQEPICSKGSSGHLNQGGHRNSLQKTRLHQSLTFFFQPVKPWAVTYAAKGDLSAALLPGHQPMEIILQFVVPQDHLQLFATTIWS